MKKQIVTFVLAQLAFSVPYHPAYAENANSLRSPEHGVLCDRYMCANDKGVSQELTVKHLGKTTATRLFSQGDFDLTEFTFANGIFCDVKVKLCREHRYYGEDGKPNGAVSKKYTDLLFPQASAQ